MSAIWGIDLGGTKIEGVVLKSTDNLEVISRLRVPTEASRGYQHILNQAKKLIDMLSEESGLNPEKLGIGTPGTIDPATQTIKNSNTSCLNGMPLKKDVERKFEVPVAMANDANCFALAETHFGAVKNALPEAEVVFGVILGTGVGGGLVVNGKVVRGRQGIAGEWGHNFLDESGGRCYCGRVGCVETIISGPALQRFYEAQTGNFLTLKEITERYYFRTDFHAIATIERLIYFFGKAIAPVINIVDPYAVVIGGGVGNIDSLYTLGVEEIKKYVFNNRFDTKILKPVLGDSAGVFGAAMLNKI